MKTIFPSYILKTFLICTTVILTSCFFYVFYNSSILFLSALVGIGISSLITPVINNLEENFKIPRFIGAITFLIIIFLIFGVLFLAAGTVFLEQFSTFKNNFPEIMSGWEQKWSELISNYPKIESIISKQSSSSSIADSLFSYLAVTFSGFASALTGIALAAVIALFTSVNAHNYYKTILENIPEKYCAKAKKRLSLSRNVLQKWFTAQLIDMGILAVITTLSLWLIGIKYWALFGLMTGILCIIPYVGIITVVFFAGCVVSVTQPDKLLPLVLVFIVTQQIEGNFILPKLMKDHVHIPAAPLIFSMVIMGVWFGFLGILITPPLLAILVAQYNLNKGKENE